MSNPLPHAAAPLTTPTYDGSGQAMHPGVVHFSTAWRGYEYWMVVTPYPFYDASKETPSILVSHDGLNWGPPAGLENPVTTPTGNLADGDLLYEPGRDQLWLFYLAKSPGIGHLMRQTTKDGIHWSKPEEMFQAPANGLISPTVAIVNGEYCAWYVNAAPLGSSAPSSTIELRTSHNGKFWSAPTMVNLAIPGQVLWHIQVIEVPERSEQWMVAAAYPAGKSSGATILFFGTSTDTLNWTMFSKPLLGVGNTWDAGQIYRSSVTYDAATDLLRLWYSARDRQKTWRSGYTQGKYADILAFLER